MDKMRMESEDIQQENVKKITAMFPNCVTEARDEEGHLKKAINFELLKQMLSDSVIDGDEAYEFTWVGKKASIVEANRPIRKTLRPVKEDSVNWDTTENLYIEGDNLEVLKLLQESYLGKVKMIYIDPPYNTGHDFVYPDSFIMDNEAYNEGTGYFDEEGNVNYKRENSSTAGKYHSDWCSMIYSRLMLSRNLLTKDGLIFISIDDNEITNLRKICEEIFGERNFVAEITLLCNPKGRSQDKYVASCHEYVLIYSNSVLPNGSVSIPKTNDEIAKDYSLFDENGKPYRELELRNTHRDFGKFNRPKMFYPIFASPDGSVSLEQHSGTKAVYPLWDDGFEGCWTWEKTKHKMK